VGAKAELERYLHANPTFRNNQLCKFVDALLGRLEGRDAEGFDAAVNEFKRYNSVDAWLTRRLDAIRRLIDDGDVLL
jgi:hypothetical protein